jgi:FMN phosphatase YigB (HAD superfamily)
MNLNHANLQPLNLEHLDELLDSALFIFDLDGTLYEETAHFLYYGQRLAEQLAQRPADDYLAEVERALSGAHPLTYGVSYDPVQKLIVRDGVVCDWEGHASSASPSSELVHVDDPWSVYGVTAAFHGITRDRLQDAFLATRRHMESDQFSMQGMPGLREVIDDLHRAGRSFVLATNSPEPDSRVILEKLGLTGAFDDHVFNAKKQDNAVAHFTRWQLKYRIPFERMVSIGDHYRNEIQPAVDLGMKTIYIDRYLGQPKPDVTVQVRRPAEVADVLKEVYSRI